MLQTADLCQIVGGTVNLQCLKVGKTGQIARPIFPEFGRYLFVECGEGIVKQEFISLQVKCKNLPFGDCVEGNARTYLCVNVQVVSVTQEFIF